MIRSAVVIAAVVALAGCGGSSRPQAAPTTPPDPGRTAADSLVRAAATNDTASIWQLLSTASRRRAGGTLTAFDAGQAPAVVRAFAPFTTGPYRVLVSERLTDTLGVVALARGSHAYAFPLALEGGTWHLVLPGKMSIVVLGPQPGSTGPVAQVGAEVHGSGVGNAVLYVDGQTVEPHVATAATSATVLGNLPDALPRGRHSAVVFVSLGNDAAARAWTFKAD